MRMEVPMSQGALSYRVSRKVFLLVTFTSLVGMFGVLAGMAGEPGFEDMTKAWVGLGVVTVVATLLVRARFLATIGDSRGLVLRGWLRSRRIPWADVHELRSESYPASGLADHTPQYVGVVYLRTGRRLTLPHVNDRNLSEVGLSLTTEIERLQKLWEAGRGTDWHPASAAARRAAVNAKYPLSPVMVGLRAALVSMPLVIIVLLVPILADVALAAPLDLFIGPIGAFTLPIAVGVVAGVMTAARRRTDP
jgi:hypothetical protein